MAGAPIGNHNAAKAKKFEEKLRLVLAENDYEKLRKIAQKAVDAAEAGESWAIQFVADRLDGKPKQQTELSGADGKDLRVFLSPIDADL